MQSECTFVQDGNYPARLQGAQVRLTSSGKLMLVFAWELEDGRSIRSYSVISQQDGTLNPKPIGYIKRWAPTWDGVDPYWFEEHLPDLASTRVRLSIRNEPSYRDPAVMESKVSWVNPIDWTKAAANTANPAAEDPEAIMSHLDRNGEIDLAIVQPTMNEVWAAYAHLCRNIPMAKRNTCWIAAMKRLVPGKDQTEFTTADWQTVLDWIRS